MKTNEPKFKAGQTLFYNDGRPGHVDIECVVLEADNRKMVVSFADRADTTTIFLSNREWTSRLTVKP